MDSNQSIRSLLEKDKKGYFLVEWEDDDTQECWFHEDEILDFDGSSLFSFFFLFVLPSLGHFIFLSVSLHFYFLVLCPHFNFFTVLDGAHFSF